MTDPKEIMTALLRHLKSAEKEISAALDLFQKFPRRETANAAKRMDRLIRARTILNNCQFNLPRDWERSKWFRSDEHKTVLQELEDQMCSDG